MISIWYAAKEERKRRRENDHGNAFTIIWKTCVDERVGRYASFWKTKSKKCLDSQKHPRLIHFLLALAERFFLFLRWFTFTYAQHRTDNNNNNAAAAFFYIFWSYMHTLLNEQRNKMMILSMKSVSSVPESLTFPRGHIFDFFLHQQLHRHTSVVIIVIARSPFILAWNK